MNCSHTGVSYTVGVQVITQTSLFDEYANEPRCVISCTRVAIDITYDVTMLWEMLRSCWVGWCIYCVFVSVNMATVDINRSLRRLLCLIWVTFSF